MVRRRANGDPEGLCVAYALLGLQTDCTAGEKEVRVWTIHVGDTTPKAAGVIHGDFEKGFIRAAVIGDDDDIACRGEAGAKDEGASGLVRPADGRGRPRLHAAGSRSHTATIASDLVPAPCRGRDRGVGRDHASRFASLDLGFPHAHAARDRLRRWR